MQIVDMEALGRKKHFEWFNSFSDPTFSINLRIDVTKVVRHAKTHGKSFFIELLYLVTEALHSIPEMRMRIKGEDVVIFDMINPAYTILTDDGNFDNCRHQMTHDYDEFYAHASKAIAETKAGISKKDEFNDLSIIDDFYITSVPWVDITAVTHPQPTFSRENMSIPRICWGKYTESDGVFSLTLNLAANHALVDGKPLSFTAVNLQTLIDRIDVEEEKLPAW